MTRQQIHEREAQIEEDLAQLGETQASLKEALIRKGTVTKVLCQKINSKYCQASRQLTELQEQVEDILDMLKTMESVLADIQEA